jgi:phosphonate transport system permease protein
MNISHQRLIAADEQRRHRRWLLTAALIVVGIAALIKTGCFDAQRFSDGLPAIRQLGSEMIPPNFERWEKWVNPLLDTLLMSIAGTALTILLSLPLALLAAPNTSPHPLTCRATRTLLASFRSVPEIILGILFVAAVGFGALPGVLALALHSTGMVGKFYAEAIEHVDPKPMEAAAAAGASRWQVVTHAVIPQVLPQLADITIYRWEYHFRASAVLGIVGAGGIGFELMSALRLIKYDEVSAILLSVLACVLVVDSIGAALRKRLK